MISHIQNCLFRRQGSDILENGLFIEGKVNGKIYNTIVAAKDLQAVKTGEMMDYKLLNDFSLNINLEGKTNINTKGPKQNIGLKC